MTNSEKQAYRDMIGLTAFEAPKANEVVAPFEPLSPDKSVPTNNQEFFDINLLCKFVTLCIYAGALLLTLAIARSF